MKVEGQLESALLACTARYEALRSECRREGLNLRAIRESRTNLTRRTAAVSWLKVRAYRPTGVALGNPLTNRDFTRTLEAACDSVERRLAHLTGITGPFWT